MLKGYEIAGMPMPRHVVLSPLALSLLLAGSAGAQERNLTMSGRGTLEGGRAGMRDVREVRLTLRENADFRATIVLPNATLLVTGSWRRPGMGNVDQLTVREVSGAAARGSGTLVYAGRGREVARRLTLRWSGRDGDYALQMRGGADDDERPDRPGSGWSAGTGTRVFQNIDARAQGEGMARMSGIRGGAFSVVRARIGTGGDVIIDVRDATRGELRGRVRRVEGRRVEVGVRSIFGYTASGTLTVELRSADEVRAIDGEGTGERGAWTLEFDGRGLPNDYVELDPRDDRDAGGTALDADERGRGTLTQAVGPALDLSRATVALERRGSGRIVFETRRDRVTVDGRWSQGANGRVRFEVRRINDRTASGTLTIRRERNTFTSIEGDGLTQGGRFAIVFAAR